MHVHVRYTRLDEKSHEAAPNKDGLHDLHERKPNQFLMRKLNSVLVVIATDFDVVKAFHLMS